MGLSRSPQGECGLKYVTHCASFSKSSVAPRKGSVD